MYKYAGPQFPGRAACRLECLFKNPRALLLYEPKTIRRRRRCGSFRADRAGFSHILFPRFYEVNFQRRIHLQSGYTRTEKTAETYIFRIRLLLKVCSMRIDPCDFYVHAKPDSDLCPGNGVLLLQPRQATPQGLEIDGFLKRARRTQLFQKRPAKNPTAEVTCLVTIV